MSTIYERGDGCEKCIDGRVPVIIDGEVIANTACDCKLPPDNSTKEVGHGESAG